MERNGRSVVATAGSRTGLVQQGEGVYLTSGVKRNDADALGNPAKRVFLSY